MFTVESSTVSFQLKGCHYVCLRQLLRSWACIKATTSLVRQWDWPFHFVKSVKTLNRAPAGENAFKALLTPWFLVDPPDRKAQLREADELSRLVSLQDAAVRCIQKNWKAMKALRPMKMPSLLPSTVKTESSAPVNPIEPSGGRGRGGRGRGRGGRGGTGRGNSAGGLKFGELLQAEAKAIEAQESAMASIISRLNKLCSDSAISESLIVELKDAVRQAETIGLLDGENEAVTKAVAKISRVQKQWTDATKALSDAITTRPINGETLREALRIARQTSLALDTPEVEEASRLYKDIVNTVNLLNVSLTRSYNIPNDMVQLTGNCKALDILLTTDQEQMIVNIQAEETQFDHELVKCIGENAARRVQERLCKAHPHGATLGPCFPLDNDHIKNNATSALTLLKPTENSSKDRTDIDSAIAILERQPMTKWPDRALYLALANTAPSHIDLYKDDAQEWIEEYVTIVTQFKDNGNCVDLVLLLVLARLHKGNEAFYLSCLRRCGVIPYMHMFMSNSENQLARTSQSVPRPTNRVDSDQSTVKVAKVDESLADWEAIKAQPGAIPCSALDELMKLVGLKTVKEKALELYRTVMAEKSLPPERRVPQTFNFALLGNPGTGKTTVGKLLGKMLFQLGVRKKDIHL